MSIYDSEGNTKLLNKNGNLVAVYSGKELPLFQTWNQFEENVRKLNLKPVEPEELILENNNTSNYNGYNVSCYGQNNGFITANITGGVIPYDYSINGGLNFEFSNGTNEYTFNKSFNYFKRNVFIKDDFNWTYIF